MTSEGNLTYKAAGVDIDAGDALVERIKHVVQRTQRPEVLGGIGGFGGLFRVPGGLQEPVLVAGTDGVGTKLKLAIDHDAHDDVGIDLVAMCANDVVVCGAEPLFFLDYFVTPKLDVDVAERVIASIARGCELAGAALLGGETAEHPGMHTPNEYDLAGFCVGIVERSKIIDGRDIVAGDKVIGLASSGPHSNGFSLIRHVLARDPKGTDQLLDGRPLIEHLLTPTRIYVRSLLGLLQTTPVKGMAHITGGGLLENIPRVLPAGLGVELDSRSWEEPAVFGWLARAGVPRAELHRTFNCGVGMVVIVASEHAADAVRRLETLGERAWTIGEVVPDPGQHVSIR
ncbi:MAG TPA: phosphoribosylformylglycinamidine cyclo-ligase [Gammaproteobacteria bacterium]